MNVEKTKILLIEDDTNLSSTLRENLEKNDFQVEKIKSGKEVYDLFQKQKYDLCLLNVNMLLKDDFAFAKEIKVRNKNMPIIFLATNLTMEDALEGFNIDANDFVTKPFHMEELLMRIRAVLRRGTKIQIADSAPAEFTIGKYIYNRDARTLLFDEHKRNLTSKELQLIHLLVLHKNELLNRSDILKTIWGENSFRNSRSLDVFITKLRQYLKYDQKVEIINIHGKGFKLVVKS